MKIWQKTIVVISTFALLLNSLAAPLTVLAQTEPTETPSPTPEATTEPTATPEATVEPTATPEETATPEATPTEIASPTPEETPAATDLVTPAPTDQPTEVQAPESNPTTQGPPIASPEPTAEAGASTPTFTPVVEPENATVTTTVVTTNVFPSTVQNDLFKLITDKLDYSPTELAIITGSNFTPNKTYSLTVASTDDPATSTTVDVTTDGSGSFTYNYQLDGNYRPNYSVKVKDGESVVATTTFTDSRTVNSVTLDGGSSTTVIPSASIAVVMQVTTTGSSNANDWQSVNWRVSTNPSTGGTSGCVNVGNNTNGAHTYTENFNITSPNTTGTYNAYFIAYSGTNCSNESGSDVGPSTTLTLSNGVVVISSLKITLCHWDNGQGGKWTSNDVNIDSTSKCLDANGHGNHSNDIIPSYTYGSCIYNGKNLSTNFNGTTGQTILDNDCIVPPQTGTITVHKVFDTHYDWPGTYANSCFTLNPNPSGFGQICANSNGYATFSNVRAGTYSVNETKTDTGYSQENNNCTGLVIANNGDSRSCTVTNTHDTGDLKVKKVVNDGSILSQWSFSLDGGSAIHADSSGVVDFGQVITNDTHYVTESGPSGYHFVSFTGTNCNVQPTGGYSAVVTKSGTTTCTFTNARDTGNIKFTKIVNGGTASPSNWTFNISGDGTATSGQTKSLNTGTYTITESGPSTYNATAASGVCSLNPTKGSITLNVTRDGGTCTITNTLKTGSIKICKVIVDAQGNITNGSAMPATSFRVNWTGGLGLAPTIINSGYTPNTKIFSTSETNDAYCVDYPNIPLDNYGYSAEIISNSTGWETPKYNDQFNLVVLDLGDFKNYKTPGDENSNGYMDLTNQAGPNRTLVILNQYKVGSVTVTKFNDANQDGELTEGESVLNGWTINLGDKSIVTGIEGQEKGKVMFTNVLPGRYNLSEDPQDGWIQTNIFCTGEGTYNDRQVVVAPGANVQCYIGNFQTNPKVLMAKTNDKSSGVGQSDTITYTLSLENTGNVELENVNVYDVPPAGFTYVVGTTTINGAVASDPSISSGTLTWNVSSLAAGATVKIVYQLKTPGDLSDGTYTNFAACSGGQAIFEKVLVRGVGADCDPTGVTSTVTRGQTTNFGGNLNTVGQVLGASTELPGTGSPTVLLIIALGALGAGLFIRGYNIKITKKAKGKTKKHAKK
jgi:uncharacterized repeat protein (TIGR01451 family)